MSKRYGTLEERFWRHVSPEPNSGCWLWDGPVDENGYGRFRVGARKERTHRLAYRLHCGSVPPGFRVLHACDIPACVNPSHLRLGTDADNVADKVERDRCAWGERLPSSKLTAQQVAEIRRRDGQTHRSLAAEFGVSHSTIGAILNGVKWKRLLTTAS